MSNPPAPTAPEEIATLRLAVEAASGPSRELDGSIHNALYGTAYVRGHGSVTGFFTSAIDNGNPSVPHYTSSIDASLALSERVLPGWVVDALEDDYAGAPGSLQILGATCELTAGDDRWAQGMAATRPLAILAALLRALETRHEA